MKYNKNLQIREQEILSAYKAYCYIMRSIFGTNISLPSPKELESDGLVLYRKPKLYVYGKKSVHGYKEKCMEAIKNRLGTDLIVISKVEDICKSDIVVGKG